ncbi:hypothetical protein [Lapidilactobacillus wuchangensis]|uniref:hypothetical protein n=1 Tax=Lapidilactobacillus wuchangensis TaxID=2486001 RepID=UPI000F76A6F0|nr:hypothetical protein [Lapidilactobacillus wuchangensis]
MAETTGSEQVVSDEVGRAFLAFYLDIFKSHEMDLLTLFDEKNQIPEVNHFLTLAPHTKKDDVLQELLENRRPELTDLLKNIIAKYPDVATMKTPAAWHNWYTETLDQVAQRTSRD